MGGSSVLNYMLYVRGNKRDYDGWAKVGNYGWSFEEVLPYFIKSEDNRNPYLAKNKEYHGTGGYLTVQEAPYQTPLSAAFVQAGVEMGKLFILLYMRVNLNYPYLLLHLTIWGFLNNNNENRFIISSGARAFSNYEFDCIP